MEIEEESPKIEEENFRFVIIIYNNNKFKKKNEGIHT